MSTKIRKVAHITCRLTPQQREKLKRLGGTNWLREAINAAPESPTPGELTPTDTTPAPWAVQRRSGLIQIEAGRLGWHDDKRYMAVAGSLQPGDAATIGAAPYMEGVLRRIAGLTEHQHSMAPWLAREALASRERIVNQLVGGV